MRLDLFLKVSRLVLRRSKAKELCDNKLIKINERISKPSHVVKEGDIVEIDLPHKFIKVKVLKVPQGKNVPRKESTLLYQLMEEKKKDLFEGSFYE